MNIKWFGTASLAVETEKGRLLIDPFVPFRGSPTRVTLSDYAGYDAVLVTHGHFDHIMSLPALARISPVQIYCTRTPAATLARLGVPGDRIHVFSPGDALEVQGMRVTAYQSRHVRFDRPLLRRTILNRRMLRYAANLPRAVRGFLRYPENGETVALLIEGDGFRVMAMGSLNLAEDMAYPADLDLLALPYQGSSDLLTPTLAIIRRLRPRAVLLDHCDDAFPPVSADIDTSDIESALAGVLPVYRLKPGERIAL